ncbi:ORF6N domain-containing protein [Flavobacterium sp. TAB 87]|uniref:ORF6N domain-containing protein n=1 Tax=Flavobacterium sp. TAB 87 TaxID=1729581 RepID=UPI00076DE5B4|nr:ORF6N domain-containing protein [Flavobacterium sp. TAB 87]KVV13458.1 ORF6N domain protein [Flavobacterium sp. TAB 87]
MSANLILSEETISNAIYYIQNQKVMLDRNLAVLYGIETRVLKQAVKRNISRFPGEFMFELTKLEFENWRSQFVTSNSDKMGLRYAPMAFTEHGILMLSSVLKSDTAIQTNI